MAIVHIAPKDKKRVLDPISVKALPVEGMDMELTPYWQRREDEGSVIITPVDKDIKTTKKEK